MCVFVTVLGVVFGSKRAELTSDQVGALPSAQFPGDGPGEGRGTKQSTSNRRLRSQTTLGAVLALHLSTCGLGQMI